MNYSTYLDHQMLAVGYKSLPGGFHENYFSEAAFIRRMSKTTHCNCHLPEGNMTFKTTPDTKQHSNH